MVSRIDLHSIPYFAGFSDEEIRRIEGGLVERAFARGEILFVQDEPCQGLYLVKSGQVNVFKSSPEGREQVLFIARPGDTFNDVPVFDGGPNPASAIAIEPSTVYIIPGQVVLSLIAPCPAALSIIKPLAARLRHLSTMVEDLSFRRVVSRVAKLLLEMAVVEGGPAPIRRLTQDDMAAMVGSVRDVIGRALKSLEKAGAIKIEGQRISVVSQDKLRELL